MVFSRDAGDFSAIGYRCVEAASSQAAGASSEQVEPPLTLYLNERGAEGTGREVADGFVVLKCSLARIEETLSIHDYMREQRQLLQMRGVLAPQNGKLIFTQDFRFSSPSTAAGVLVGGSANGRLAWKDLNGVTLKSLQDARLAKI
ncbi:DUF4357 domain-containing protein [Vreelandella hamiltonii]|uniref:DUF4357 domain-containing protein n=1 Tax=Vreelandella hamiltonii TaxID=502829 RepID=UPI001E4AD8AF|nr:DUF4357 domain-containing protein [Halomonas hamiltonii]